MTAEPTWRRYWPDFEKVMQERLDQGHLQYGDDSFECLPADLIDELAAEAADIVGWGFVLWVRLQRLRAAAAGLR